MLFSRFCTNFGKRWELWMNPSKLRRYCPVCFTKDIDPHLRLSWRITFAVVCPRHAVLLESKCGHCGAPFGLKRPNPHYNLVLCPNCGLSLASTKTRKVSRASRGYIAVRQLLAIAGGRNESLPEAFAGEPESFFDTLSFLLYFIPSVQGSAISTTIARRGNTIPADDSYFLRVLGIAWSLLANPAKMSAFIHSHQSKFNRQMDRKRVPNALLIYAAPLGMKQDLASVRNSVKSAIRRASMNGLSGPNRDLSALSTTDLPRNLLYEMHRDIMLNQIEKYIMSTNVAIWITVSDLAKAIGERSRTLQRYVRRNQAFHNLVSEAQGRTRRYFESLECHKCSNEGIRKIGLRFIGRTKKKGTPSAALVQCMSCGSYTKIDVDGAPTHRQSINAL